MRLDLRNDLPFIAIRLNYQSKAIEIPSVLVDTGSATTILAADRLSTIGLIPSPLDRLYVIRGVGGSEVVFVKRVDSIQVENKLLSDFEIEVGGMDYGFEINGILGMNFLTASGAVIDLKNVQLTFSQ